MTNIKISPCPLLIEECSEGLRTSEHFNGLHIVWHTCMERRFPQRNITWAFVVYPALYDNTFSSQSERIFHSTDSKLHRFSQRNISEKPP